MPLRLRNRHMRTLLRACLPELLERNAVLVDAGNTSCRVALSARGAHARRLLVELIENRAALLAHVKVRIPADDLITTYASHGTSGEPVIRDVLARIDASRALTWEADLDAEGWSRGLGPALDAFWAEWCAENHAADIREVRAAIELGRSRFEVFVAARRSSGLLPDLDLDTEWPKFSRAHPLIALGADATLLGAAHREAAELGELAERLRRAVPPEPWPDAAPIAAVVGDG